MTKKRVLMAMSGGVDSSVAACLLLEQGYEVIGMSFKVPSFSKDDSRGCCGTQGIEDARRVADKLGIPFYAVNYEKEFSGRVIKYFCNEYFSGRTPNPCIVCNKKIKFGLLLEKARSLDAQFISTGHYAGVENVSGRFLLKKGADTKKDQTYFLFALSQEQLASVLFPLARLTKENVRKIAGDFKLKVHNKPGSQEICFLGGSDYREFLRQRYGDDAFEKGDITDSRGNILGKHEGVIFYTIGQRKGIGAQGRPFYVTGIDAENNRVIIGEEKDIFRDELTASDCNWIAVEGIKGSMKTRAAIRYNHVPAEAEVFPLENGRIRVKFEKPQRAVTPGQAVVFYDGDYVVGGAWIE